MAAVSWDRLLLRGFGCYATEVSLRLPSGLGVLVGPNETGKTTLIDGLSAVLFGLPAGQDPSKFNQARYRNWQHSPRFAGELHFTVDGSGYHLQRDFSTNRILLRRQDGSAWRELAQGVDNPNASRPHQIYRDWLRRLIGISQRELFQAAFCLSQPLPASADLDQAVQELLSGGGASVGLAQGALERQVKQLTRHYGEPLGSKGKGNKDRQLEQLNTQIAALQQQISTSRAAADGLRAVQAQLAAAEAARSDVRRRLQAAEALAAAWGAWRTHRERHELQLREQQQLQQALAQAEQLQRQLAEQQVSLDQYADLGNWEQSEQRLRQLEGLEAASQTIDAELLSLSEGRERLQRQRAELLAEQQALPPELANPQLAADHAHWLDWRQRQQYQELAADRLAECRLAIQQQLAALPDFSRLGEQPLRQLREWLQRLNEQQRALSRWRQAEEAVARLRARLQQEFQALEAADAAQLELLQNYRQQQWELRSRWSSATREQERLAEREQAYVELASAWRRQFDSLPPTKELLTAISQRIQAGSGSRARRHTRRRTPLLPVAAGIVAATLTYAVWGRLAGGVGVAGSCLIGLFGWLLGRWSLLRGESSRTPIPAADSPLQNWPFSRLVAAQTLLEQLLAAESRRPGPALAEAEAACEQARRDQLEWQQAVGPFQVHADPPAAYGQWRELRQELRWQSERLEAAAQDLLWDPLAPGAWFQLNQKLQLTPLWSLLPEPPQGLIDLLDPNWLEQTWAQLLSQAESWQQLQEEQARLSSPPELLPDSLVLDPLSRPDQLTQQLGAACSWSTAELAAYCQQWERLQHELTDSAARLHQLSQQQQQLQARQDELARNSRQLLTEMLPTAASSAGLDELRQRLLTARRLQAELTAGQQTLQALLSAHRADSLPALQRQSLSLGNAIAALHLRWQELVDGHPGLPSILEAAQPDQVQRLFVETEQQLAAWRQSDLQSRQQVEQLLRQQASLEGQEPCNLAAAWEQLQTLTEQRDRLQLETAALGLAYRELSAAKLDYERTHRQQLAERVSSYFQRVAGGRGRRVELDGEFRLTVLTADGIALRPTQLSRGAQDQLYFSLRLAIADLLADQCRLPLILDDPFVNSDQSRLCAIRETVMAAAADRQLWLCSHQPDLAAWGEPALLEIL